MKLIAPGKVQNNKGSKYLISTNLYCSSRRYTCSRCWNVLQTLKRIKFNVTVKMIMHKTQLHYQDWRCP